MDVTGGRHDLGTGPGERPQAGVGVLGGVGLLGGFRFGDRRVVDQEGGGGVNAAVIP
jgi:hypothetical protein